MLMPKKIRKVNTNWVHAFSMAHGITPKGVLPITFSENYNTPDPYIVIEV